ncbi:MAG TPA: TetR family transcriptional regulator C-terminal domain-containing protein [Pseudonocardiaceae bacterium]|jgi:DNA-binding transcriptional regulator YbjK|nr:TetR family transcriptional regulator C-terminal domain-containing protein [Pseudonocardiaceae bacterium]
MATPNTPTQERSRARRDALLRAAIGLVAEGGVKAVTHRAVAARAGLPLAATTYYFESIQQLTEEALLLHVAERVSQLDELAEAVRGARNPWQVAERIVDTLLTRDQNATIAQFEVYLEAARNPALRETVAETFEAFETLASTLLSALGARRPAEAASAFVAVVNGFALNGLARPGSSKADAAALLDTIRALFVSHIMTDDELAHWRDRLHEPINQPTSPAPRRSRSRKR